MAYEGLISDWSSDVCSSDLDRRLVRRRCRLALDDGIRLDDAKVDRLRQRHADRRVLAGFHGQDHAVLEELHGVFTDQVAMQSDLDVGPVVHEGDGIYLGEEILEIVRESCRERVCQYV